MRLGTLTLEQCELVRTWRNLPDVLPMLRTREPLTAEQQATFYRDIVCDPSPTPRHRYYALSHEDQFVGMGGLTYLDRVEGEGEISLILGPDFRQGGLGTLAVDALRTEGGRLGLQWIVGTCYDANPGRAFWVKTILRCEATAQLAPDRLFFRMTTITGAA